MNMKDMLKRKTELTPQSGFNLVGVDDYDVGADALYLIAHFDTRPEAEAAKKKKAQTTDDTLYIYGK